MSESSQYDTIIWFNTAFLGDLVLTTGAFATLRKRFPKVRQVLITHELGKTLLHDHSNLDLVLSFDKKEQSLWQAAYELKLALGDHHPSRTLVLQVHKSFRSSLICRFMGFKTITYAESAFSSFAWRRQARVSVFHETVRIALLLEQVGVERHELIQAKPFLDRSQKPNKAWVDFFMRSKKVVALAPGSVWATKRWPLQNFAQLAEKLLDDENNSVVVLGSAGEKNLALELCNKVGQHPNLLNLAGQTSLDELRWIYPNLSAVVANDSSPIHFASAFDIPTLAIFGATISQMGFGPLASKKAIAEISIDKLKCRPCSIHGPKKCPLRHFKCMKNQHPGHIWPQLQELLA